MALFSRTCRSIISLLLLVVPAAPRPGPRDTHLQRPDDRPWGHRDFMVADPDGNVVSVTTLLAAAEG
jgi:hypothetical protein